METLFDKHSKVIGRIITLPDGRSMIQTPNQTINVHGGLVGRGNFLTNLLNQ
jgi:hypothetical protein